MIGPRCTAFCVTLALLAALTAAPARAAIATDEDSASKQAAPPDAAQAQSLAKDAEKRESEASKAIEEMLRKAATPMETPAASPPPGSPPRGARKTIYGDIIIHK